MSVHDEDHAGESEFPQGAGPTRSRPVTQLLGAANAGDASAFGQLFALVSDELRLVARHQMAGERADHTLQPTALVNEVFLRLARQDSIGFADRGQFFGAAAGVMRRVLVDHARRRRTAKRGGGAPRQELDAAVLAFEANSVDLLALDEALALLAERDPRKARLVELHFFAGLGLPEAAPLLGVTLRTAERDWKMARAWLRQALSPSEPRVVETGTSDDGN